MRLKQSRAMFTTSARCVVRTTTEELMSTKSKDEVGRLLALVETDPEWRLDAPSEGNHRFTAYPPNGGEAIFIYSVITNANALRTLKNKLHRAGLSGVWPEKDQIISSPNSGVKVTAEQYARAQAGVLNSAIDHLGHVPGGIELMAAILNMGGEQDGDEPPTLGTRLGMFFAQTAVGVYGLTQDVVRHAFEDPDAARQFGWIKPEDQADDKQLLEAMNLAEAAERRAVKAEEALAAVNAQYRDLLDQSRKDAEELTQLRKVRETLRAVMSA